MMLEHALQYFPSSLSIKQLLIKIYSKLGLVRTAQRIANGINTRHEEEGCLFTQKKDYEKVGATMLSVATNFD